jgi:hypothetical protein
MMAVVVSIAAVYVSTQANRIANRQAEIAERELQPIITAGTAYEFEGGFAKSESLTVRNDGAPARGFDVDEISLLYVTYQRRAQGAQQRAILIDNYYTVGLTTGRSKGKLVTFVGDRGLGNNMNMVRLDRRCRAYAESRSSILLLDLVSIVRVTYVDQLNEERIEYLTLSGSGGSLPLSAAKGGWAFSLENEPGLSVYDATPADVLSAWKSRGKSIPG